MQTFSEIFQDTYNDLTSQDTEKTNVVFRKFKDTNEIIALFPTQKNNLTYMVMSYMHVGQHSEADYYHCVKESKPCTESEYKDLFNELTNIGYNLVVKKKAKIVW